MKPSNHPCDRWNDLKLSPSKGYNPWYLPDELNFSASIGSHMHIRYGDFSRFAIKYDENLSLIIKVSELLSWYHKAKSVIKSITIHFEIKESICTWFNHFQWIDLNLNLVNCVASFTVDTWNLLATGLPSHAHLPHISFNNYFWTYWAAWFMEKESKHDLDIVSDVLVDSLWSGRLSESTRHYSILFTCNSILLFQTRWIPVQELESIEKSCGKKYLKL